MTRSSVEDKDPTSVCSSLLPLDLPKSGFFNVHKIVSSSNEGYRFYDLHSEGGLGPFPVMYLTSFASV